MGGKVYLVGAGPGDPELLTLKAVRAIGQADVVVYDRLVSDAVLAMIPKGALRIDVGKRTNHHPVPQEEINEILVRLARRGRTVVRLKGGEEAMELAEAGVPYFVVPGITSAQGCLAALGIPLTHRGLATGIRLVTGHCRASGRLELDWQGLADPNTTLVVYMGLASLPAITAQLIAHGLDADMPALAVSRGTLPEQRHVVATLATLTGAVTSAQLESPVLFVIGEVVRLARLSGVDEQETCDVEPIAAT